MRTKTYLFKACEILKKDYETFYKETYRTDKTRCITTIKYPSLLQRETEVEMQERGHRSVSF